MAVEIFTGDGGKKTIDELYCTAELTGEVHKQLIFLSVLNIVLSITAFLGNSLILVALHKESSLHPPSKLLYRSLAITDLCVGIIAEPLNIAFFTSAVNERWNICRFAEYSNFTTSYILCFVSLFTLAAISVDRLLALLLGLRYRQVVTLKKTYITLTLFWVMSIIIISTYYWNFFIHSCLSYVAASLCLVTSIFSYTKIFLTLRYYQIQVQDQVSQGQPSQAIPLNIARYRKAVYSALWVQVTLIVCYLPYGIAVALTPQAEDPISVFLARQITAILVYLNSSLNPLLYCWKIRGIRQAVKDTIRQLCCS